MLLYHCVCFKLDKVFTFHLFSIDVAVTVRASVFSERYKACQQIANLVLEHA